MRFVYQVVRAGFEPRRGVGFAETRVWDNEIGPRDLGIAHRAGDTRNGSKPARQCTFS